MADQFALNTQVGLSLILTSIRDIENRATSALVEAQRISKLINSTSVYRPSQPTTLSGTGALIAFDPNAVGVYNNNGQSLEKLKKVNTYELPDYDRTKLVVKMPDKTVEVEFLLGINSLGLGKSNSLITNKTRGGWFMYRLGPNLMQLTFTGNLLDTKAAPEKAEFLHTYKTYIEDQKDSQNRYYNDSTVILYAKGYRYLGYITGLQISDSAQTMFYASYSVTMVVVKDTNVYSSASAKAVPVDKVVVLVKPEPISSSMQVILTATSSTATE